MSASKTLKEALFETLVALRSPINSTRSNAEQQIKVFEVTNEYGVHLAELCLDANSDWLVRQSASGLLQNYIDVHWSSKSEKFEEPEISKEDKMRIRSVLLTGLGNESLYDISNPSQAKKIRESLAYSISTIAYHDWPDEWPELFNILLSYICSGTSTFRLDREKEVEKQILSLKERIDLSSKELAETRGLLKSYFTDASREIKKLTESKQDLNRQLAKLLAENELLLGKHLAKSEELQAEAINLPENLEEIQFYCLKLKEDLITTLVAKERNEENYQGELLFLKDQQKSEQQVKDSLIQSLTDETENLRSNMETTRTRYKKLKKELEDTSKRLIETEASVQGNNRTIMKLEKEVNELNDLTRKLNEENAALRQRVADLQNGLESSEQVQKDFVKLSQSLQIELEKIRQADTEVRWQHDEDVFQCNSCKKALNSKKDKHHCCHCGKIFCSDCNSKTIHGGPNRRPFKVCNVCHTLLNRDTAPYFSSELPQSPT